MNENYFPEKKWAKMEFEKSISKKKNCQISTYVPVKSTSVNRFYKKSYVTLICLFTVMIAHGQIITAIDHKGTKKVIGPNNTVTTTAIAPTSPLVGDIWFDTSTYITKTWNGTTWDAITNTDIGDIKYGLQNTDHTGWVLLDGRAISMLTATQQAQASALGFATNLPDATDRMILSRNTGNIGDIGGNNEILIKLENLPNITYTGTTQIGGAHTHTISDKYTNRFNVRGAKAKTIRRTVASTIRTTSTDGEHGHAAINISSGGNDVPVNIRPLFFNTNIFIFLGN